MEIWQTHMEKKVDETFNMVKEIRDIVVGSENYKDTSIVHRMGKYEAQVEVYEKRIKSLEDDKLERSASIKATKNIMRILWGIITVLAGALGLILKNLIQ